jgi:hypothetical protein
LLKVSKEVNAEYRSKIMKYFDWEARIGIHFDQKLALANEQ